MTTEDTNTTAAGGSQLVRGVRPVAQVQPIAYLYHDAATPEDAHPWLHSTMLVLAADRRPGLRNETPLVTLAQAEAMVAAERERLRVLVQAVRDANRDAEDADTFRLLKPGQERAWIALLAGLEGPNA